MPAWFRSFGFVLLSVWLANAGSLLAQNVSLQLDDGTVQIQSLEIGRSLSVRVFGLAAWQQVSVVLRDGSSQTVVSAEATADGSGEVEMAPLWSATGIVGCDCETEVGAYLFQRAEGALQALVGETFEVAVVDILGTDLATVAVPLVTPTRPIGFPADATGCPRFLLQDSESLHLLVIGGAAGTQNSVTVAPGLFGPVLEARQSKPEGPSFSLGGQAVEVIFLWPGPDSTPGGYRVLVSGSGWPAAMRKPSGPINSGVVVEDHSCPPPLKGP